MPTFVQEGKKIPYATEEEVLDFCNKVREAGGGESLSALLPGRIGSGSACLIAKSLNFDCEVWPHELKQNGEFEYWYMHFRRSQKDAGVVNRLAEALDLEITYAGKAVKLPRLIGNAAHAFDCAKRGWTVKYREPRPL